MLDWPTRRDRRPKHDRPTTRPSWLDPSSPAAAPAVMVTEREHDVLTLLVAGYSYSQISRDLLISEKTVGYHLSNIYGHADVGSRHELIDWVRAHPGAITIGSAQKRK